MRLAVVMCSSGLLACSLDSGGAGLADTLGDGATSSTSGTQTPTSSPSGDSDSISTSAGDASASGGDGPTSSTAASDTSESTTTQGNTATESASGGTSTSGTSTPGTTSTGTTSEGDDEGDDDGDDDGGDDETTAAQPEVEHLQNADLDTCTQPLWCFYNGDIDYGTGDGVWSQECFEASLPPPFEITQVHYVVAETGNNPVAIDLQIRPRDGNLPGGPPTTIGLPVAYSSEGEHTFELPDPVQIDDSEFCIGFRVPDTNSDGAVGIAVDDTGTTPGLSWLRLSGSGACNVAQWLDATTDSLTGDGNWCIDVMIREVF